MVQQSVDMVDPPVFLRIAHAYHGFEAVNHLARAKTMDEAVPFNLSQHPHAVIVF